MTQQIIKSGFIEHFKGLNNPNKSFNTIIFTSSGNLKRGYESDFVNILNLTCDKLESLKLINIQI